MRGKSLSVKIFECFDYEPIESIEQKSKTISNLQSAINDISSKDYLSALNEWKASLEIFPEDKVIKRLIEKYEPLLQITS